jgi:hypothetical protein
MANHLNPQISSLYLDVISEFHARIDDVTKGYDGVSYSNIPVGAIGWQNTAKTWYKWNGTSWDLLNSDAYAISITGTAALATKLANSRTINGAAFDGSSNITVTANTTNPLTFSSQGNGSLPAITFNGSVGRIISYNSIGAAAADGSNASGSWGINITGSAGSIDYANLTGTIPTWNQNTSGSAAKLNTGTNGWVIEPSGTDLVFKHNNTTVLRLSSTGTLTANGDVIGFGNP